MKTIPVVAELAARPDSFEQVLVHTGQHYDRALSDVFFEQLSAPDPDYMLGVGSGSHAKQTATVIEMLEPVLLLEKPDLVLVPGDVNSTLAAALTAAKLDIPVAHIEAGLRSFDRTMPEELNRIVVDQLSNQLYTHSPEAETNLLREGRPGEIIFEVGNTMIDSLVRLLDQARQLGAATLAEHSLTRGEFVLVTLHRPALVDGPLLADAYAQLVALSSTFPVIFPVHPRTRARLESLGVENAPGLHLIDPAPYLQFVGLMDAAAAVLTDSGGVQEETTYLGVPCFTLRDNTERPVTVSLGTNTLLGLDPARIAELPALIAEQRQQPTSPLPGWDGAAAARIVDHLAQ